ncbi:tyrosine lyase ThiH [Syntrophobotulus glycolicus DSM 8271]|uniref:Tyrosine lyase ThiH n=1 Tax=Syntrophobotulus glycolicus (strain DSM 8271 / FlGlyR) TaxID=645991 RepID=F0SYB7_SYNGF|nr:2-iminoacetate synthase ThiH [Syntrophobotulus glycolicus]ADY55952.1 tyrosine lyase ThiH [Syntrophobotulus glycolicus DSM 8271]
MSFYDDLQELDQQSLHKKILTADEEAVNRALSKENLSLDDYAALLSPAAGGYLEQMAKKAQEITFRHFGKVVILFAPIYLANYCVNQCLYCGFNVHNRIGRGKLNTLDVARESKTVAGRGIKNILLLTGESRQHSGVEYIKECVQEARKYFPFVSLEVYPLDVEEYQQLTESGVDGLTLFQEAYDEDTYKMMHPGGPKSNYRYRLEAPERGCQGGIRSMGIGALLGLHHWRTEAFFTALHANFLMKNYPDVEVSVSLPRMRPHTGSFQVPSPVNDKDFVQIMLALRLFLPNVGITISTRERPEFRDNLIGIGLTRMSAGAVTEVGGYSEKKGDGQFDVSDSRSVEEIRQMLYQKGFQPVFKDWQNIS